MTDVPASGPPVLAEVAQIVSAPGGVKEHARALLVPLRRIVPFTAAWLGLYDQNQSTHTELASEGYDSRARGYFTGGEFSRSLDQDRSFGAGTPVLRRNSQVLADPGGAAPRDGLTVCLRTEDGRQVGVLALHGDAEALTDAAAERLCGLAPVIAQAIDPMRPVISAAQTLVDHVYAGVVLTHTGVPQPVPGLPPHPLLAPGSATLSTAARELINNPPLVSFLCPSATADVEDHLRVTAARCRPEPPVHADGIVLVSPPGNLLGLTGPHLRILGLLIAGCTNPRIMATLRLAPHALAAYLEQILTTLAVPSLSLAAVRALRSGLYVPPTVTETVERQSADVSTVVTGDRWRGWAEGTGQVPPRR